MNNTAILSIIEACELSVHRLILASALADTMAERCEQIEVDLCKDMGLPYIDNGIGDRCLDWTKDIDNSTEDRFYARLLQLQRNEFPGYEDQPGNPHLIEESRVHKIQREIIDLAGPFTGWTFNQLVKFETDETTGKPMRRSNGKLKMKLHTACDLICKMVLNKETLQKDLK